MPYLPPWIDVSGPDVPIGVELYASRDTTTGRNPGAILMFLCGRTLDERAVRLTVLERVPAFYEIKQMRLQSTHQQHLGGGLWRVQVNYGIGQRHSDSNPQSGGGDKPGRDDPLGPEVTVDIGAATQKIKRALQTYPKNTLFGPYGRGYRRSDDNRNIPDYANLINVSRGKNGEVQIEGCDFPMPSLTWTETWTFLSPYVTWSWVDLLSSSVGRTNGPRYTNGDPGPTYTVGRGKYTYQSAVFRTFYEGEVMFLGAHITPFGLDKSKVTFTFKQEPGFADQILDPNFPAVSKKGHQYISFEYEQTPQVSPDGTALGPRIRVMRIHEVGRPGETNSVYNPITNDTTQEQSNEIDFSDFGIGN
jgi:hypothetical protein